MVSLKVALGYFVHPKKSVLIPKTRLVWLGLSANFLGAAFSVPSAKGERGNTRNTDVVHVRVVLSVIYVIYLLSYARVLHIFYPLVLRRRRQRVRRRLNIPHIVSYVS